VRSQHPVDAGAGGWGGAVVLHDRGVAADILRDAADRRELDAVRGIERGAAANPALVDALHGHHTQVRCTLAQLLRLLVGL
jgi:hypothetical protein